MRLNKPTAWFEVQYNNRQRVPDSADVLARWAEASALVRRRADCRLDLRYGAAPQQTLDVFAPDAAFAGGFAPVLVFIHGGYWRALDKSDYSFLAASFTDEGALVILPNHDLCPDVSIDRIATQLTEAVAWAWRHAAEHGGDPSRIILVGHSAGGHLAAMLSCCDWKRVGRDLPRRLVQGAMSVSGLHDLAPLRQVSFLQPDLRLDAGSVRRLSPCRFPPPAAPQTLYAVVGQQESEEYRRQNRLIQEAWGARAVPVCEELPGCNHFTVMHDLADPEGRSHQLLRRLLGLRWYSGLL
ncbi:MULTISPECIES: alpha/beta hydrolase [unclassified Roseateles]|uniref:alpha/beta hydrolase n=1 Tax=unclassified Roseateles TaxID=2626991 RepID=UPI0006F3D51D|nr:MULTISPECIES: alpha/beta hydrolase [unclassified Roseateles]KQW42246.1 esterase [Pelomonas sp. Root405]KRA68119.1 esterase [Pelomonas sp. Root662]